MKIKKEIINEKIIKLRKRNKKKEIRKKIAASKVSNFTELSTMKNENKDLKIDKIIKICYLIISFIWIIY